MDLPDDHHADGRRRGGGPFLLPASAFAFAVLSSLAVYAIAQWRSASTEGIILGGVALLFLFNAGVAFLQYVASEDQMAAIVFWLFGSLQGSTWPKLGVVFAALSLSLALPGARSWQVTALRR